MKKIISFLLFVALTLTSVLAMIPISAATKSNVMGDSNADKQFAGQGNVFYYDYHKYVAAKGGTFTDLSDSDKGETDYMLRLGTNAGSGTASVCDGVKNDGPFSHSASGSININGIEYKHGFGYSFKESVVVDAIAIYLPAETTISEIDVYGASLVEKNGAKVYGKEAEKTLLASFKNVDTTTTVDEGGKQVIKLESGLNEALKIDYIFLALQVGVSYKFYEIELTGIMATEASDFTALKEQYARIKNAVETDYTEGSWAELQETLEQTDTVNQNCLASLSDITAAATSLKEKIDALTPNALDKTALNAKLNEVSTLVEAEYTPTTWATFISAKNSAVTASESATLQSQIDANLLRLSTAVNGLRKLADKTDLNAKIDEASALTAEDYTEASWEILVEALAAANTVKANNDATASEVTKATDDLTDAIEGLVIPGDTTALAAKVAEAKTVNKADYVIMGLTWANFETALASAEEILVSGANQTAIDDALKALTDAITALGEKKPAAPETDAPETDAPETDAPETDAPATQAPATQAPATQPASNNGGCGSSIALSAIAVVGIIGTAVALKKKED